MWWLFALAPAWAQPDLEAICSEMNAARDAMSAPELMRTGQACLAAAESAADVVWQAEAWDTLMFGRYFAAGLQPALEAGNQAIAHWEEHGGAQSAEAAYTRVQMAKIVCHAGHWTRGIELAEQALAVVDGHEDFNGTTMEALELLGSAYLEVGRANASYAVRLRLLPMLEASEAPDSTRLLDAQLLIAESAVDVFRSAEALGRFEDLERRTRELPASDPFRQRVRLGEAAVRYNLGDYANSRRILEDMVVTLRAQDLPEDDLNLPSVLVYLSTIMSDHGDGASIDLALEALEQVEAVVGPDSPMLIHYLGQVSTALRTEHRYEEALAHTARALALAESMLPPDSPRLVYPLVLHANNLKLLQPEAAREMATRAAELAGRAGQPVEASRALTVAALAAEEEGAYDEAIDLHRSVVTTLDAYLPDGHPMVDFHRSMWGRSMARAGRMDEAVGLQRETLANLAAHSQNVMHIASVRERLAAVKRLRLTLDRYLAWGAGEPLVDAWQVGLRMKGLVTRSMGSERSEQDSEGSRRLTLVRATISQLTWSPQPDAERLAALTREKESLERELGRTAELRTTSPQALCDALGDDESIVDVYRVDPNLIPRQPEGVLLAYVANGGADCMDTLQRIELGEEAELQQLVGAYRLAVERHSDPLAIEEAGLALRRASWDRIAPAVGDAAHVHLAADGPLVLVPWAGLPTDDGGFLVEQRRFSVQSMADDILAVPEPQWGTEALVVGDVDYGEASLSLTTQLAMRAARCLENDLAPLPATALEALDVTKGLKGRRPRLEPNLLTGELATVGAVVDALPRARVVHLATHGFFADERCRSGLSGETARAIGHNPLALAGLALAGANEPSAEDDGLWTAEEVSGLDLSHVELVVLSACESGLGVQQAGEGLLGVRQALRVAGAHNVVSTLWSVPDEPTRALMSAFYRHWSKGRTTPAQALQAAQQDYLRQARAQGDTRPDAWAAFVVTGR